ALISASAAGPTAAGAGIAAAGGPVVPTSPASVLPVAYRQPAAGGGSPVLTPFGEALLARVRQVARTSGGTP
uniref:hypothetical protein n=1 Tax=Frankia sp. CiP1_Cm_nod1 TaxID=2897160 RepID=UPI0020256C94